MIPRTLRAVPPVAIAVCGLLLALRAALGPLAWPVRMNSPLNAEGICALAALVAFAARAGGGAPAAGAEWKLRPGLRWTVFVALVAAVALAYARALGFYFLSDDFIIVHLGRTFHFDLPRLLTTGGGDGFFRPFGYVSLGLTGAWAGANPLLWHAASLAVHLANTALVLALAVRVLPSRTAAVIAAALFGIHGTRPEVAVWIAGRFDLVATFFVLAGLVLFLRGWNAPAFVCMVLGILSKESAYVFPLLLVLLLWCRGERRWRAYAVTAPFFLAAAALFVYRWRLFEGIGGYPATFALLPAVKALAMRAWAILFFPVNWSVQPGFLLGALTLAYAGALALLAWQRKRFDSLLPVGFVLIACLPPLSQLLISADLQKSRMLYLPSVGFCLLLGGAIARRRQLAVAAVVLAFHVAALEHNLGIWQSASVKVRRSCEAAAQCGLAPVAPAGLPGDLHGAPFFANGFNECVGMAGGPGGAPGTLVWDASAAEVRCERGPESRK